MQREAVWQELADLTRREFVSRALTVGGWGAFATVVGTGAIETVSFFFPRVRFEPPSTFRIGTPSAFLTGDDTADAYGVVLVDDHWKAKERFIVVRERDRIVALFARCTHLGCTVNWFPDARIFKCPCHGSQYHSNGTNFAGPAPRPLDHLHIDLAVDGQLVVDTSIVYGPDRFGVDGAFVRV